MNHSGHLDRMSNYPKLFSRSRADSEKHVTRCLVLWKYRSTVTEKGVERIVYTVSVIHSMLALFSP